MLTGLYIFRRELSLLIASLEHLKLPGDAELDWKKEVQEAERVAEKIEASPNTAVVPSDKKELQALAKKLEDYGFARSPTDYNWDYYRKLAKDDPNLALAGLRMELERMLQNLSEASGAYDNRTSLYSSGISLSVDTRRITASAGQMLRHLRSTGILGQDEFELLQSILHIANAALHGRDATEDEAVRVIKSAEAFKEFYLAFMVEVIAAKNAKRNNEAQK